MSNVYRGSYSEQDWYSPVTKNGIVLDPARSLKVRNHSPDGFSWSYCGSGCAQLALGILLEETDQETAQKHYQDFKFDKIAGLPNYDGSNWEITSAEVQEWLDAKSKPS